MCHVLIIEDEPLIAMTIQDSLQDEGATSFDIAVTEDDAVQPATTRRPYLMTSDVSGSSAPVRRLCKPSILGSAAYRLSSSAGRRRIAILATSGIILSKPLQQGALATAFHQSV
jgi:CheY-like chemotaxis protein